MPVFGCDGGAVAEQTNTVAEPGRSGRLPVWIAAAAPSADVPWGAWRVGSGDFPERSFALYTPSRTARALPVLAESPRLPQAPVRTLVPPRPDPALPNHGVTWESAEPAAPVPEPAAAEPPALVSVTYTAAVAEPGSQEVSIRVVITVNGEEHVIEIPPVTVGAVVRALTPATAVPTPVAPAPPPIALTPAPVPAPALPAPVPVPVPVAPPAVVSRPDRPLPTVYPRNFNPAVNGVYRVQVGSFARTVFAQGSFDALASADFTPNFEIFACPNRGRLYRVVVSGVAAAEIPAVLRRLGNAGFETVLIRREN